MYSSTSFGRYVADCDPAVIVEIVSLVAAIIFGLLTGYYFEHRSSRAVRTYNSKLEQELEALRHSIYSMGGRVAPIVNTSEQDLVQRMRHRALDTQNADGRVLVGNLIAYFTSDGCRRGDIDDAISRLCSEGRTRIVGKWIEMQ